MTLQHLAIILDGNRRWAKIHGLSKSEGYFHGAENVRKIAKIAADIGIKHLSLYSFSHDNWNRPKEDIDAVMDTLDLYLTTHIDELNSNGVHVKFVGNMDKVKQDLLNKIFSAERKTCNNTKLNLYIAFSYGGKHEIISACNKLLSSGVKQVDHDTFKQYLYVPEMPDIDLVIRTSGERRISNFMLWHMAYAELWFTDKHWPDFDEDDLKNAVNDFNSRERRFGSV